MEQPIHRRADLHFVWIGLPLTVLIGAGAWLGVPGVIIPMALLVVAWLLLVSYFWVMWPQWKRWRVMAAIVSTLMCIGCAYLFLFVFEVDMHVRFLDGSAYSTGGEEINVAMELTNRGKPTSLIHWRAILIDSSGHRFTGDPLTLGGDSVPIVSASRHTTYYALPDCDLIFETAHALETGDSKYGVLSFVFRDFPARPVPPDTRVVIQATDMLGRTVSSPSFTLAQINKQYRDVFPCREVTPPPKQ